MVSWRSSSQVGLYNYALFFFPPQTNYYTYISSKRLHYWFIWQLTGHRPVTVLIVWLLTFWDIVPRSRKPSEISGVLVYALCSFFLSHMRLCVSWTIISQPGYRVQSTSAECSRDKLPFNALSEDRIRQCVTSSGSRHKDTDQCLQVAISFRRHHSVPVRRENGSAETTVAEESQNPVAGLWGHTLGESWPPSSYASIDMPFVTLANSDEALNTI